MATEQYLSNEYISSLLRDEAVKASTRRKHKHCINGIVESGAAKASVKGAFEGKVGTVTRSRKGATRRNANGRRYYVPGDCQWYTT